MLKGVIFDMDGVIINSEPQHYEAYMMVCREYKVEFPYEDYKGFIGGTHDKVCEYLNNRLQIPLTAEEIREKVRKNIAYLIGTEGYEEIPGVKALIKNLYEHGVKLAIASSSPVGEIRAVVKALEIEPYFEKLVSGESVQNSKPFPDVFLKALEELGVNSEECIVIEDSGNGTKAGVAAGMPVIGFYNPDSGNQDLAEAAIVVEGFEEVDYEFTKQVYERAHKLP